MEARSAGRITVRLVPRATLSNSNQRVELEMVQSGALDASLESSILLSIIEPRFSVFSLPWLFPDHATANAVCDGPMGQQLLRELDAKHLVGLAYGVNGFRQITNNRRPIRRLDDLRYLKIRIPSIELYTRIFRLFGADPSPMNFGELIAALKAGTMDGQENPLAIIHAARLYEVQAHVTIWNYSYDPIILCFNHDVWRSFRRRDQVLLRQAAVEAFAYERELAEANDRALPAALKEKGMQVTTLSAEEIAAFRRAAEPIYKEYETILGAELVRGFQDAVAQCLISND